MTYHTVEELRGAINVTRDDFRLDTDAELEELLERWAGYAKGLIDDHTGRDWSDVDDEDPRKQAVLSVAERVTANFAYNSRANRDPILIADNQPVPARIAWTVFPKALRDDLPGRSGTAVVRSFVSHGS